MPAHEHEWSVIKSDGLGPRCLCGKLREPPGPDHLWLATAPPDADHEHQYAKLDDEGWHCIVAGCKSIRLTSVQAREVLRARLAEEAEG